MTERLMYLSLIYYLIFAPGTDCFQPPTGLQATLLNTTLPIGLSYFSTQAVFDGKDSIYVMGGANHESEQHCTILQYSITSDQINCVANLFEDGGNRADGTANLGKNGKIYFSTRQTGPFDLYEFDPITNQVRGVEVPMTNKGFMYSAVTNSGSLILMYWIGENTTVYEWHINATTYRTVAQLPFYKWGGSVHYLPESNKILIVGSYVESRTMALLDVETGQTEILPSFSWSITSGADVVVNGELFRFGRGEISDTFLWYDLAEQHQAMVEIQNFPHNAIFSSYTGVYVQPLNRVYMFGGYINLVGYVNDIWYVDMTPLPDVPEVPDPDIPTICDGMKGILLEHYGSCPVSFA